MIRLRARIKNTSDAIWLPRNAGLGAVLLGCHVYRSGGEVIAKAFIGALTPAMANHQAEKGGPRGHLPVVPHETMS